MQRQLGTRVPRSYGTRTRGPDLDYAGLTNSAVAARLGLSPKTVRNYVSEIFSKLQVADRAQAIIRARDAGVG